MCGAYGLMLSFPWRRWPLLKFQAVQSGLISALRRHTCRVQRQKKN